MQLSKIYLLIIFLLLVAVCLTVSIVLAIESARRQAVGNPVPGMTGIGRAPIDVGSQQAEHPMNLAREPEDWWAEILERHGHVGPWNVFGYRIGKAILREMGARWGDHSLIITCHIPLATPYSCLVDGIAVGTGNSQGRLDLRIGEVATLDFLHIGARSAKTGVMLVVRPNINYLRKIEEVPESQLESLGRECANTAESDLFTVALVPGPRE